MTKQQEVIEIITTDLTTALSEAETPPNTWYHVILRIWRTINKELYPKFNFPVPGILTRPQQRCVVNYMDIAIRHAELWQSRAAYKDTAEECVYHADALAQRIQEEPQKIILSAAAEKEYRTQLLEEYQDYIEKLSGRDEEFSDFEEEEYDWNMSNLIFTFLPKDKWELDIGNDVDYAIKSGLNNVVKECSVRFIKKGTEEENKQNANFVANNILSYLSYFKTK